MNMRTEKWCVADGTKILSIHSTRGEAENTATEKQKVYCVREESRAHEYYADRWESVRVEIFQRWLADEMDCLEDDGLLSLPSDEHFTENKIYKIIER
jgi:hypothetical protein